MTQATRTAALAQIHMLATWPPNLSQADREQLIADGFVDARYDEIECCHVVSLTALGDMELESGAWDVADVTAPPAVTLPLVEAPQFFHIYASAYGAGAERIRAELQASAMPPAPNPNRPLAAGDKVMVLKQSPDAPHPSDLFPWEGLVGTLQYIATGDLAYRVEFDEPVLGHSRRAYFYRCELARHA